MPTRHAADVRCRASSCTAERQHCQRSGRPPRLPGPGDTSINQYELLRCLEYRENSFKAYVTAATMIIAMRTSAKWCHNNCRATTLQVPSPQHIGSQMLGNEPQRLTRPFNFLQVKDKVLLAGCEGMLAERARMIARTCGLQQFPPFIQVRL